MRRPPFSPGQGLAELAAKILWAGVCAVTGETPSADTVTRTVSSLPGSFVTGVNVAPVAPLIGNPLRSHWYAIVPSAGSNVPTTDIGVPTRGRSASASPLIVACRRIVTVYSARVSPSAEVTTTVPTEPFPVVGCVIRTLAAESTATAVSIGRRPPSTSTV